MSASEARSVVAHKGESGGAVSKTRVNKHRRREEIRSCYPSTDLFSHVLYNILYMNYSLD